jgi:hypothetical protein
MMYFFARRLARLNAGTRHGVEPKISSTMLPIEKAELAALAEATRLRSLATGNEGIFVATPERHACSHKEPLLVIEIRVTNRVSPRHPKPESSGRAWRMLFSRAVWIRDGVSTADE